MTPPVQYEYRWVDVFGTGDLAAANDEWQQYGRQGWRVAASSLSTRSEHGVTYTQGAILLERPLRPVPS